MKVWRSSVSIHSQFKLFYSILVPSAVSTRHYEFIWPQIRHWPHLIATRTLLRPWTLVSWSNPDLFSLYISLSVLLIFFFFCLFYFLLCFFLAQGIIRNIHFLSFVFQSRTQLIICFQVLFYFIVSLVTFSVFGQTYLY